MAGSSNSNEDNIKEWLLPFYVMMLVTISVAATGLVMIFMYK